MDITCPKCKTEYEFEDSKISEAGVTVKCTTCNYMFRVRRKAIVETEAIATPFESSMEEQGASEAKPWMIRSTGGQLYKFRELTTLQQWIVERKVSRDDHISKSGETWKRLGDIAELASFFQVVDAAVAAEGMAGSGGGGSGVHAPLAPPVAPPAAAPGSHSGPDSFGVGHGAEEPAFTAGGNGFQAVGPSAAWEAGGDRLSGRHAALDVPEELPRRGTIKILAIIGTGLILGVGVVLLLLNRDKLQGTDKEVDVFYQAGRKFFLMDDEESLRQADLQLAKAPAESALAQAARGEVFTTWAQHLQSQAELLERRARLAEGGGAGGVASAKSLRLQASKLKDEADRKLIQAEGHVKKASTLSPERGEVKRALADLMRMQGSNASDVLSLLSDVRKALPDDPETLCTEGAFWMGQGNANRAEQLLKESVTGMKARQGQNLLRSSFLLAMIALRGGRRGEAKIQGDFILQLNGGHQWARELQEVIALEEKAGTSGQVAGAAPDSGAVPGGKPPDQPEGGTPGGTPPDRPGGGTSPGVSGSSYESLVSQGSSLIEKGRTLQAFKLFERALTLKPNGVEAMTGLGYCHLDEERFGAAISYFKRALAVSPTDGDALIGMAESYKVQGVFQKALDYYRAYLQAHPGGGKAVLARRNVTDLERKVAPQPVPDPGPAPEPTPTPGPEPKEEGSPPPAPPPPPAEPESPTP